SHSQMRGEHPNNVHFPTRAVAGTLLVAAPNAEEGGSEEHDAGPPAGPQAAVELLTVGQGDHDVLVRLPAGTDLVLGDRSRSSLRPEDLADEGPFRTRRVPSQAGRIGERCSRDVVRAVVERNASPGHDVPGKLVVEE